MKILHTADWHIGQFKGPVVDGVSLFVRILYIRVTFFFAVYPFMDLNTILSSDSMDHAESAKQNCTYALIFPA